MKLRNKKTGEIFDGDVFSFGNINSLAEFNEEWEDCEEPNIYYFIDIHGEIKQMEYHKFNWQDDMKQIGNYFETREEAEQAVKKLKAWKRLKDKCCISFSGLNRNIKGRPVSVNLDFNIEGRTTFDEAIQNTKDLMLLFGGKDESSN